MNRFQKKSDSNPNVKQQNELDESKYIRIDKTQSLVGKLKQFLTLNTFFSVTLACSIIFTINSIIDCPGDKFDICAQFLNKMFKKYINKYILVGSNFSLIFILSIQNILSRKLGIFSLFVCIYFVCFYDNVISMQHYGGGVTKLIGIFTFITFVVFSAFCLIQQIYNQNRQSTVFILLITAGLISNFFKNSCYGWNKGLFNLQFSRSKQFCQIKEPQYCPLSITQYFSDLTPILAPSCENKRGDISFYQRHLNLIDESMRYVGFANTLQFPENKRIWDKEGFQYTILQTARSFNSLDEAFGYGSEIALDLEEMKYQIKIERKEELVRKRQSEKKHQPLSKNILVIFIDAVSRAIFHRSFKQTIKFLENREAQKQGHSIQFFRAFSMKPYTNPNLFRYNYEIGALNIESISNIRPTNSTFPCQSDEQADIKWDFQRQNISNDNQINLTAYPLDCVEKHKQYNDARFYYPNSVPKNVFRKKFRNLQHELQNGGFITGRSSSFCTQTAGDTAENDTKWFYDEPGDHEGVIFACDPHYHDPVNTYGLLEGPYSVINRCLNGKTVAEYTIEYATKFYQQYKNDSTYFSLEFIEGHEPTGTVLKYLDETLAKFLQWLQGQGILDDTLVVLYSDHGNHMHYFETMVDSQQFFTQRMMPILVVNTPKSFNEKFPAQVKDIDSNQQKLVTLSNVHFLVQTWIQGFGYQYFDQSLLSTQLPSDKSCEDSITDYEEAINSFGYPGLCVCVPQIRY